MKKSGLFLACCIAAMTANAQSVTFGPELGLNMSSISTMYNGNSGSTGIHTGLKAGAIVDLGFTPSFSLQTGTFYSVKGSSEDIISVTGNENLTTTTETKLDYRINYLEIPLNLQFKIGHYRTGQFFFGGGPYFAFAVGGNATREDISTATTNTGYTVIHDERSAYGLRIGNDAKRDDVLPNDMGLNLNLGIQTGIGLFARANWGIGLSNTMPGGNASNYMQNNNFTMSVGYMFGH